MDLNKLAYWSYNQWSGKHVLNCFTTDDDDDHCRNYWIEKFNQNILQFYISLDKKHKDIFEKYGFI